MTARNTEDSISALPLRAEPNAEVVFQRVGDTVVLLHLGTDKFYELNRTGARFWELLAAGDGPAAVHEQMMREFDVDPAELAREVQQLLASLAKEDLIHVGASH